MPARSRLTLTVALTIFWCAAFGPFAPARAQIPQPDSLMLQNPDYPLDEPDVALLGNLGAAVWSPEPSWGFSTDAGTHWTRGGVFPVLSAASDRIIDRAVVCAANAGSFYAAVPYSHIADMLMAVYSIQVTSTGATISSPHFAAPEIGAGGFPTAYDSPHLACDSGGHVVYLSYTHTSPVGNTAQSIINVTRSVDGGMTWTPPVTLGGTTSNGSSIAVGPDGGVTVAWEDFALQAIMIATSADSGVTFSSPIQGGTISDDLGNPPVGWKDGLGRYAPGYSNLVIDADFPSLAIDTSTGPTRGNLYLAWADYVDGALGTQTGSLSETEPNDGWGSANAIHIGDDISGSSLSADFGGNDCDYFYFDGVAAETIELHGQVTGISPTPPSTLSEAMELFCGADTVALTRVGFKYYALPNHGPIPIVLVTLPRTGRYYVRTGCSGFYSYSYKISLRDWVPSGNGVARDQRDIVLARSTDGGHTWSAKRRVSDSRIGVDDCLPRVVVDASGRVHVAWYDRRDDPGCGSVAKTYWTHSEDGALSFAPSAPLSTAGSDWTAMPRAGHHNIGDHLALAANGTGAFVGWVDGRDGMADLYRASIVDQATAAYSAGLLCRWDGGEVALAIRIFAGLPPGTIAVVRTGSGTDTSRIESGGSTAEGTYSLLDREAVPGQVYTYTVLLDQPGGSPVVLASAAIAIPGVIATLELGDPYPNPSTRGMHLRLAVPREVAGSVDLYDVAGHRVRRLASGTLHRGVQELSWDGRDEAGRMTPSGVYFVRVQAGHEQFSREVLRMN